MIAVVDENRALVIAEWDDDQSRPGPGDTVVFEVVPPNPDQAWFWTESWQRKEREVDEDIAAGRVTSYVSDEEFLASLTPRAIADDAAERADPEPDPLAHYPARFVGTVGDDGSIVVEPADNYLALPGGASIDVQVLYVLDAERVQRLRELRRLQEYGAARLAESGYTIDDIPRLVNEVIADPSSEAVAAAEQIVAEIRKRAKPITAPHPGSADERLRRELAEVPAAEGAEDAETGIPMISAPLPAISDEALYPSEVLYGRTRRVRRQDCRSAGGTLRAAGA